MKKIQAGLDELDNGQKAQVCICVMCMKYVFMDVCIVNNE